MKNLINFLIQYSVVLLFLLLEIISFSLLVKNQDYHKSIIVTSSNSVVSSLYETSNFVLEFFRLSKTNESLAADNADLRNQIIFLQSELSAIQPASRADGMSYPIPPEMEYHLISAKVINNSTNKLQNYITINKGSRDGIEPDMGVISEAGVVGIIKTVSDKFSVVIPVLNQNIKINSKFKKSNYIGPLVWDGKDYRYAKLTDIARHVEFSLGDTLVTSGFTSSFPEGIPVGFVNDFNIKESDAYYNIQVQLVVNFRTLSYVKVINYHNRQEQIMLENNAKK